MKHLNQYKNESFNFKSFASYKTESFNSKSLTSYITEYIIKKKLDKPIDSEDHYEYSPKTKDDLIKVIHMLLDKSSFVLGQYSGFSESIGLSRFFLIIYSVMN